MPNASAQLRRSGKWLLPLFAGLLCLAPESDYRQKIAVPPQEIFSGMLRYSQEKNFAALQKSSQLLQPLYQEVKKTFAVELDRELEAGMAAQDPHPILQAVRRIIFFDLKLQFHFSAQEANRERATIQLKIAYLDYLLLAPEVQKKNFTADQLIRKLFQKSFYLAGAATPYSDQSHQTSKTELAKLLAEIEGMITQSIPGLTTAL